MASFAFDGGPESGRSISISRQTKLPRLESLRNAVQFSWCSQHGNTHPVAKAGIKLGLLESGGQMEEGMMIDEAPRGRQPRPFSFSPRACIGAWTWKLRLQACCSCGTAGANRNQFHITRRRHPVPGQDKAGVLQRNVACARLVPYARRRPGQESLLCIEE